MHVVIERPGGARKICHVHSASQLTTYVDLVSHSNLAFTEQLTPRSIGESLSQPHTLPLASLSIHGCADCLRIWSCVIGRQAPATGRHAAHLDVRPADGAKKSKPLPRLLTRGGGVHLHASRANSRGRRSLLRILGTGTPTPRCGVEGPARCCGDQPAQERARCAR